MIRIRTIWSILITLCWSMMVLFYMVSHRQITTHVKSKHITNTQHAAIDQEQHMCVFHFSAASHYLRLVRNPDSNNNLHVAAYWKTITSAPVFTDVLFLYSRQADPNQPTDDRVILFRQIRV